MNKNYYYHVVAGDTTTTKITLSQKELYYLEKTLSQKVCDNYRESKYGMRQQREAATLISISYHCLGGNNPCHLSKHQKKKTQMLVPPKYRFEYLSFFIEELLKMMPKFQRSKGCWTQYVRWASGKGLRRVIRLMRADDSYTQLIKQAEELVASIGTSCIMNIDSAFSEEFDSFRGTNEELEKAISDMDGRVGEE